MKVVSMQNWALRLTGFQFLVITLLVLGIFFRFVNLDHKVYWNDEAYTSLRVSGYTEQEFLQQSFNGTLLTPDDLQKYQRLSSDKSWGDTIHALAGNAEHPPLYYLLTRLWVQLFGSSIATTRSLSALLSLLAFPAIYWLCQELFGLPLTGWVAMALLAVSPFSLLYAQEARQYSLWTVTILLSSAALLRAIRLRSRSAWGLYAVLMGLGFYASLFSVFVAITHGLYVVFCQGVATFRQGWRGNRLLISYGLALLGAILVFSPWLVVLLTHWNRVDQVTSWTTDGGKLPIVTLLITLVNNLSLGFMDLKFNVGLFSPDFQLPDSKLYNLLRYLVIALILYSFYFLVRHPSQHSWFFVFSLIGTTILALALPDVILGGRRSIYPRYILPCYVGAQISMAYLLAAQITAVRRLWQQRVWRCLAISLFTLGIASCIVISHADVWWNKYGAWYNPPFARIINQSTQPLVITSFEREEPGQGHVLAFSYLIDPKVRFQLIDDPLKLSIAPGFKEIFLYRPSRELLQLLSKRYQVEKEPPYNSEKLWRLNL